MNPQVKAYMESIGAIRPSFNGCDYWVLPTKPQTAIDDGQAAFMAAAHIASTRKLLEDLKAELTGRPGGKNTPLNKLRGLQRQKLDTMISALERKGGEE